jgi:putative heme-binding domain-containing protein
MRRFAAVERFEECAKLLTLAPDDEAKELLVEGFVEAVKGRPTGVLPSSLREQFSVAEDSLPLALRLRIDGGKSLPEALARFCDDSTPEGERVDLLAAVASSGVRSGSVTRALHRLLEAGASELVELAAISALPSDSVHGAKPVIDKLSSPSLAVREAAAGYLARSRATALEMVRRAQAGRVELNFGNVALVEMLRAHQDEALDTALESLSPETGRVADHAAEITRVRNVIQDGGGNPKRGESHFRTRCSACHSLFEFGGAIGPDLTSYQRGDDEALLLAIVAPGAEIREGYENTVVRMKSGDVHAGFRVGDSEYTMVVRDLTGASRTLSKDEIATTTVTKASLMPAGLLQGLEDAELRDLFAYLRSTTPPY